MKKHRSLIGFIGSFLFHAVLAAVFLFAVISSADESANGQINEEVNTNISIEMMMAMVEAEPEPEPIQEIILEPKEEIPDPAVKPEPEKVKEPEKPKEPEKSKPKPKEKPKPKKELKPKDAVQGNSTIDSPHKIDSKASGAQTSSANPNLVGDGGKAIDVYRSKLRREIERNKRYPQRAKMMRKQGVVTVSFTLRADGGIQNPRVAKSSGSEDLDRAAIQAVQSARGIGPRPDGMSESVIVPIKFNID